MEIPKKNHLVDPDQPHMEIIDLETRDVWQSVHPVVMDEFRAMQLAPRLSKLGIGLAAMDAHYFRRSPGAAEDGPVRTRDFDGRLFLFCARPEGEATHPAGPDGPRQLRVDKHHSVVYRAGRKLQWLSLPDGGEYVHVIEGGPAKPPIALPDGWSLATREVTEERTIHLPHPTTVFFFPNGDSFQGPVRR